MAIQKMPHKAKAFADALVERKDTLSKAEKSALERQVAVFIDAEKADQLAFFEFQAPPAPPGARP